MAGLRVKVRYVFAVCAPPFPGPRPPPSSQTLGLSSLYSKGGEVARAAVLQASNSTLPSCGFSCLLCLPSIAVICHHVILLGPVDLADAGFQLRSPPPPPPRASPPPTPPSPYFFLSLPDLTRASDGPNPRRRCTHLALDTIITIDNYPTRIRHCRAR